MKKKKVFFQPDNTPADTVRVFFKNKTTFYRKDT